MSDHIINCTNERLIVDSFKIIKDWGNKFETSINKAIPIYNKYSNLILHKQLIKSESTNYYTKSFRLVL